MTYEVILPDGTAAEGQSLEAVVLAAETLIEDVARYLRENLVIRRDGVFDAAATALAQKEGLIA